MRLKSSGGASTEERKAIEAGLNIVVGSVGALVDPLGGGILVARGAIQMARADSIATDVASLGVEGASSELAQFHEAAIEGSSQALDNLLNWF